jgi:hypothetical protein
MAPWKGDGDDVPGRELPEEELDEVKRIGNVKQTRKKKKMTTMK